MTDHTFVVDVVEPSAGRRKGAVECRLGRDVSFHLDALESFASARWQPVVYDALVLAAAVEFCDRRFSRGKVVWGREFSVHVPVHDPHRWSDPSVTRSLIAAMNFLTGDSWNFVFRSRIAPAPAPSQAKFQLPVDAEAVMAFSDGLDSRAVDGLERLRRQGQLVRVRVGAKKRDISKSELSRTLFAAIPYSVKLDGRRSAESSARTRGFKFSLVSAVAAFLIDAPSVVVPESGQGALAPALIPVGHGYEDYRSYPSFTRLMKRFVKALFGHLVEYEFPRLWSTKGETLREYVETFGAQADWVSTRSCWQQARQVGIQGVHRQCGVCAACILRRLSVHAAGLEEPNNAYVWESLNGDSWESGVAPGFHRTTEALREYAIAGVLHFDDFAALGKSPQYESIKRRRGGELAESLGQSRQFVEERLNRLLLQHEMEWSAFVGDLGPNSFVRKWIGGAV